MTLQRKVMSVALGGVLVMTAGASAFARDRDYTPACRDRLNADKARIDRDAHRFGEHSRQVDRDVDRMEGDRKWCRDHKAEWDHNIFDFGL